LRYENPETSWSTRVRFDDLDLDHRYGHVVSRNGKAWTVGEIFSFDWTLIQPTQGTANPSKAGSTAQNEGSNAQGGTTADVSAPPSERNTRSTSRALTKKGEDLPYGTPVPGRQGFVTSPFSPNSGYIDVRGFAPGTPVKDPYTGKVFLTP